jgi:hypothetical protein
MSAAQYNADVAKLTAIQRWVRAPKGLSTAFWYGYTPSRWPQCWSNSDTEPVSERWDGPGT